MKSATHTELAHYDYSLPRELVAQTPLAARSDARLLVVKRQEQAILHRHVRDLPDLLDPRDCLVINDTRVVPARLVGRRTQTGGHWEGLFLSADEHGLWQLLGKTRGRLSPGETITLMDVEGRDALELQLIEKRPGGVWIAKPNSERPTNDLLDQAGRVPLPHYIRHGEMTDEDRARYQTVFARNPGSVAAPTAGLHFTNELLGQLVDRGVTICRVTLHVGLGTFRPIKTASLAEHAMHREAGAIDANTVAKITACRQTGGRVVALGTTSVRLLETAALSGTLQLWSGETELFIRPPFEFHAVDAMMTNFHLPRTTLLVLVRTFGGDELIARAYDEAIARRYRFYSYGDAMLIL
ncbi:MAG: tRNA preQ1(34) S-adenosylmethionine ribosyltransferase-isomerase QueA [Planctomycetes bacterium]|nr:tRNA preQ1(34) S-adenosylmethionine ribosyltransferase-isomerase QueA [Planctomycetota bacterium]